MIQSNGYAALSAGAQLTPFRFERRELGEHDIIMESLFCGVCHSDLHMVRNEWHFAAYPMVPGHELIGRVVAKGPGVTKFSIGDLAAIGCVIDSCRICEPCGEGHEHECVEGAVGPFNGVDRSTGQMTLGGFSNNYVVDEHYALKVPGTLDPGSAAPLLCAGITVYSPLRHWRVGRGMRVGIVGLGGLGHLAIKFAHAMGAEVTVFSTSASKAEDAHRLGARKVVISSDLDAMKAVMGQYHFILDTISADHDVNAYLALLRREGTMCLVGIPPTPPAVVPWSLIMGRKQLAGSYTGGIPETQEMLDFCGQHGIAADIELIQPDAIDAAFERLLRNDVKYRFVVDLKSLHS